MTVCDAASVAPCRNRDVSIHVKGFCRRLLPLAKLRAVTS
jgi:hypothetical protein